MKAAKLKKEEEDKKRADELEAESKLVGFTLHYCRYILILQHYMMQTGVAGMSAFFKRQMENVQDTSLTNEQKVTHLVCRVNIFKRIYYELVFRLSKRQPEERLSEKQNRKKKKLKHL